MAERTILWGDEQVPVHARPWVSDTDFVGYRKTYVLRPGGRWIDAPLSAEQSEHYVATKDGPLPVGVVIARELMEDGADWAYCTELFPTIVLLDHEAVCRPNVGDVADTIAALAEANGRIGGLPDVIAKKGRAVILREAKVDRHDRLQPNQHHSLRSARQLLGDRLDAAVVEWNPIESPSKPSA